MEIMWIIMDENNNIQDIKDGNNWLTYTSISSNYNDTFST